MLLCNANGLVHVRQGNTFCCWHDVWTLYNRLLERKVAFRPKKNTRGVYPYICLKGVMGTFIADGKTGGGGRVTADRRGVPAGAGFGECRVLCVIHGCVLCARVACDKHTF